MNKALVAILCTAVLAGCQADMAWQTMTLPSANYDQAFQAAKSVLAEDYQIARVDPLTGLIETLPLRFQKTGADRTAGAYLSSGDSQSFRRTVTCRVERAAPGAVVGIRADLEREGTSQAQTLMIETEGADRRMAGAGRRWDEGDSHRATYWADIGRDEQAESKLLERIRQRLAAPPAGGPR